MLGLYLYKVLWVELEKKRERRSQWGGESSYGCCLLMRVVGRGRDLFQVMGMRNLAWICNHVLWQ